MKSSLKYKVLGLLLVAGSMPSCTHQAATVATLPDGLYFLSDSLADTQVAVADRFGEKGYTIVDKRIILHLKDTKVDFQYDVKVYADSFGIVHFTTHQDWGKLWQANQKATARRKVGLVVKDELIGWNYSDDFARSRSLTICYCDRSKEELKTIEKHISNGQEPGSSLAVPDSASKRQVEPISYHPKAYQEQAQDTVLLQADSLWVRIKKYPLMNKGKEQVYTYQDGSTERVHFREMLADITVGRADSLLFEQTVGVSTFPQIEDKAFLEKAVLTAIWFDAFDTVNGQVAIHCNICVPDTDWCYLFKIRISPQGGKQVQLITIQLQDLT
jgi:hypothetical protein